MKSLIAALILVTGTAQAVEVKQFNKFQDCVDASFSMSSLGYKQQGSLFVHLRDNKVVRFDCLALNNNTRTPGTQGNPTMAIYTKEEIALQQNQEQVKQQQEIAKLKSMGL